MNLFSQENSIYENYYLTPFIINPAITGAEYYPTADLSARQQWSGFPDAPTTFLLAGSFRVGRYDFYDPKGLVNKGPFKMADRIGLGASIYRDSDGPLVFTGGILSYAYHIPVNAETRLSFGLSAIGTYFAFNSSLLKPDQPDDPYLLNGNDNVFRANFNLGSYFYNDVYFIGISANKLLPDIKAVNDVRKEQPSFFLMGGYKFFRNNYVFMLEPSLVVKKLADANISVDIHAKLYIKKLHWIAISYGTTGRINFRFGLQLYRMLYAGYNYEYTLSHIASYNYGSHEVHLGINLGLIGIKGIRDTRKLKK
ncbi:MAG: PorP/SprF family type IX secretion system membrane protein [Bacteroidales bacterium]|nr:PorP/SprF family type IX secretion system membrane protein [Bacteroidales bacterium]